MSRSVQIIPGRLFWISSQTPPKNISESFYFNIDEDLQYQPFYMDFGPLNLGKTWKYVTQLQKLLNHPNYKKNKIYHYTSVENSKASNAAYLMGAFQVISLGYTAQQANEPFKNIPFIPFRDASYNKTCTYKCTLLDCLRGLEYAIKLGWFNYKKFNLNEYQHYERVQNGDLNWIIPDKFVAFSSPYDETKDKYGNRVFTPQDYVPIFKKMGVKAVVRLNNKTYEASGFTKEGIKHHDLIFTDGTAPNGDVVQKFLDIAESTDGAVAVHCKAGLGRTGCLIGCYALKHYRFPAADFIGWIRIARPGSILGPQQHFLIDIEHVMRQQGQKSSIWLQIKDTIQQKQTIQKIKKISLKEEVQMSQKQRQILINGDFGQGQNLVQAKMKIQKQKQKQSQKQKQKQKALKVSNLPTVRIFLTLDKEMRKNEILLNKTKVMIFSHYVYIKMSFFKRKLWDY